MERPGVDDSPWSSSDDGGGSGPCLEGVEGVEGVEGEEVDNDSNDFNGSIIFVSKEEILQKAGFMFMRKSIERSIVTSRTNRICAISSSIKSFFCEK